MAVIREIAYITGNIVIYTFLAGVLIVCAEMIWYRLPGGRKSGAERTKEGDTPARKRIALFTGASSGLGREFVLRADKKLKDTDEFWLVARRGEKLKELAGMLNHPALCLDLDLTKPGSVERIKELIEKEGAVVGELFNCAGYAVIGPSDKLPESRQTGMTDINCTAAFRLTYACIPFMGKGSRIVNVCSTAAFQPFQDLNIYAASKAFLLRYTVALRHELLPRKIMVTAVCPYWIKDTEFIEKAGGSENGSGGKYIKSYPLASKASSVAAVSLAGIKAGLPVITPGIVCTLHRVFSGLLPDTVLRYIWEGLRRI